MIPHSTPTLFSRFNFCPFQQRSSVDWQLHQLLRCGCHWRQWGGMSFCLEVPQWATLGPLHFSDFLPVVWAQRPCTKCVFTFCVCVCVYVPRERLLCPVVFTYTQFPAGSKPAGVWSELSEWPPPDIPPAALTTSALSLYMFLRKSSVHDPNTEHRHRPEYSHTHPDNHTRLIIIITPNKWILKYHIHVLSIESIENNQDIERNEETNETISQKDRTRRLTQR